MVDKNLFLYDLAVVAIFKNEGHYLKEWLDYHLFAGVEHFYLYNNNSTDNYAEVLAPYIEKNLVTLTDVPGKLMMYPAYNDAIDKYRFDCRYMAFIDIDEFVYPKVDRGEGIIKLIDEILSNKPHAAGLGINWQCFGSNGQETADYSRGVLERFTRRAPSDWDAKVKGGNVYRKTIDNPRLIRYRLNPHFADYFNGKSAVNSNGDYIGTWYGNKPILSDKIVVNHYYVKSKEEFVKKKLPQGSCCMDSNYSMQSFYRYDRNEEFDDGILNYRAARKKNFSFENDTARVNRVINVLVQTLMQTSPDDSFTGKMEIFLTCRAVAEKFQIKIGEHLAEEYALALIYRTLVKANPLTYLEVQQFLKALPEILSRPFPICKDIKDLTQDNVLPRLCEALKNGDVIKGIEDWTERSHMIHLQQLLRLIK